MPQPTLKVPGKLVSPDGDPSKAAQYAGIVPYQYILKWFRDRLPLRGVDNRVLILRSETASGKSTLLPPEIYKEFLHPAQPNAPGMICTQPRILTAIENVHEMLKYYSATSRLDETIGWSTGANKRLPRENRGMLSATVGTLAAQLKTLTDEQIMNKYQFILIDETHERDLPTDMVIYSLKNLLRRQSHTEKCPFLVLMSATFDPTSFLQYFGIERMTNFIWCRGEAAGFSEQWKWRDDTQFDDYVTGAVLAVKDICDTAPPAEKYTRADVLIFIPGKIEASDITVELHKLNKEYAEAGKPTFATMFVDSSAVTSTNKDFKNAMKIPLTAQRITIDDVEYEPIRRIILSTAVAETGLTLPELKYVIDAGFHKELEYNPLWNIKQLINKPAPRSRIQQRRGRAGRHFPGVFYPLYHKRTWESLQELQFPQILIADCAPIFLSMMQEQIRSKLLAKPDEPAEFRVEDIDMVDPPSPDSLSKCFEQMYGLGLIGWDNASCGLTKLGELVNLFDGISPEIARMILGAYYWNVSVFDVVTMAAACASGTLGQKISNRVDLLWSEIYSKSIGGFVIGEEAALWKLRLLCADNFIDNVLIFNAAGNVLARSDPNSSAEELAKWCEHVNLDIRWLTRLVKSRDDVFAKMVALGLDIFYAYRESLRHCTSATFMTVVTKLKYCLYDAFRENILVRRGPTYFTRDGLEVVTPALFSRTEEKAATLRDCKWVTGAVPRYLLYGGLTMSLNKTTKKYVIAADFVSALDGFVSWDQI